MISITRTVMACAAAAFVTTAAAQQGQGPCAGDVEKLCKDVQPGGGQIMSCLKQHQSQVSPECKTYAKQAQAQLKHVGGACKGDYEKFCMGTPAGKGAIAGCLKQHADEVSPGCKSAVTSMKSSMKH
jgi:hypothetical protein